MRKKEEGKVYKVLRWKDSLRLGRTESAFGFDQGTVFKSFRKTRSSKTEISFNEDDGAQ